MRRLLILGAGGHGRCVADVAALSGEYGEIVFADDRDLGAFAGYPVVGTIREAERLIAGREAFVAIGNNRVRREITQRLLEVGARLPTLVHPSAIVAGDARIGEGCSIMANAVITPGCTIGHGVILNTAASVGHDCVVGDFAQICDGAHLAGTVNVGALCFVGIGATVSNNVSICANTVLGAGAVVVRDVKASGTYVGVPAKRI